MKTTALLSFLHNPAAPPSTGRRLHDDTVLTWTLRRLSRSTQLAGITLLCWDDQLPAMDAQKGDAKKGVISLFPPDGNKGACPPFSAGPRRPIPALDALSASLRWLDGWRGGLLGATAYDAGFHGPAVLEVLKQTQSDALLLVDPDSPVVDPDLIDALIHHAQQHPDAPYCFSPAAPGLSGLLLRAPLVHHLAAASAHPGRLLGYTPALPGRDPIARPECVPIPTALSRTTARFTAHTAADLDRLARATASLNGALLTTPADKLLPLLSAIPATGLLPRDITLELTTRRATRPVYSPTTHLPLSRPDLSLAAARDLFREIAPHDHTRLTFAGAGDPLLHAEIFEVLDSADSAGLRALHLETDLLPSDPAHLARLAESSLDILTVHLPAISAATYQKIMGLDGFAAVLENIRLFLTRRRQLNKLTPILVPTFTKCRDNLHEMETFYDHFLTTLGAAVITAPSNCGGQIPDAGVADMSPPRRIPCRRLASRLSILSDGQIVTCEEDALSIQPVAGIGLRPLAEVWQTSFADARSAHLNGSWNQFPLCAACSAWHRP